jgi:large subunit ribosomal protein L29
MKKQDKAIREHSLAELRDEVRALRKQLFTLRWQASGGQSENPNRIGNVRRDIARHLTVIRESERAAKPAGAGGKS